MTSASRKKIAGMALGGGRQENFFLCLLEYFSDSDRWFLKSMHQVKDEETTDSNEAIRSWVDDFNLSEIVVDFPLTDPPCTTCKLECPGANICPEPHVKNIREKIRALLHEDRVRQKHAPKDYERARNADDAFDYHKNILDRSSSEHLLTKPFKRRLKKGFLPYWNRPIDFWIWSNYYDQLLKNFNTGHDSFGNISQMLLFRRNYLKRHFPNNLKLYEGNIYITLIELLKNSIISKQQVLELQNFELNVDARLDVVRQIERNLKIFIYDKDLETVVTNPKAFQSFLLAVSGQRLLMDDTIELPEWAIQDNERFLVPQFAKI